MTTLPPMTATLRAYLAITRFLPGLLLRPVLRAHTTQGADPARLRERQGQATLSRPDGPLVWVHAASVGEFLAIRDLLADIRSSWRDASLLVTTTTASGAGAVVRAMEGHAIHQFLPADTPDAVAGFLDHWRPELSIVVESDLWPRLVLQLAMRNLPSALVNVRKSRTRSRLPRSVAALMATFDLITTQDEDVKSEIIALGLPAERVLAAGDLKADADPLPDLVADRQAMELAISGRPIWSAVSTHPDDEATVLEAHVDVLKQYPAALLVWVPRHPSRAGAIASACRARGLSVVRRSLGELPAASGGVYLADTIGETGIFFRLARIVFLGGSLGTEGGHNPYEPLRLGASVLHGPNVRHFAGVYARLDAEGAARRVTDADTLGVAVVDWLESPDLLDRAATAGQRCLADLGGARAATLARLLALVGRAA
jgi:3-deoxy-D-manno-octulosonic-acid transferase